MKFGACLSAVCFCLSLPAFSQDLSDSLLAEFYNTTIADYFSPDDTFRVHYFLKDSSHSGIKTNYEKFRLEFIGYSEAYPLIKQDRITYLHTVSTNKISADTIDVVLGGWSVSYRRVFKLQRIKGKIKLVRGEYYFEITCSGTMGYVPEGRFAYLAETGRWKYVPGDSIVAEKLRLEKKQWPSN